MGTRAARTTALRIVQPPDDSLPTPVERSYLEVIAYLAARRAPVIAAQLARWQQVRPPTVSHVLQRLEAKGFILREEGGAIALTASGSAIAEQTIRRHRLLERFLYDRLDVPWHEVHREATQLEQAMSPMLEAHIAALVGDATICPHGNPIPGQGAPPTDDVPLPTVPAGSWMVLTRIDEEAGHDSCTLQLLWSRGLLPGTLLVRLMDPVGSVRVQRAERRILLTPRVAGLLWVRPAAAPPLHEGK